MPNLLIIDVSNNHLEDVTAVKQMDNPRLRVIASFNDIPQSIVDDVRAHWIAERNVQAVGLTPQNARSGLAEVSVTLYRAHPLVGYTEESIEAGRQDQDAPLVPAPDPSKLRQGAAINGGLVADGVTPLIFRLSATDLLLGSLAENESRNYRFAAENRAGGFFSPFSVFLLQNGTWRQSSQSFTLNADQSGRVGIHCCGSARTMSISMKARFKLS